MSLTKSIAKNTLIHSLGRFTAAAIGVVIVGLMTRYLGTTGYGYFTTIFAYLFFFSILGDLGLYLVTVNELGRQGVDKQKVYSNTFTLRLISSAFLMILACGLIWFFPYPLLIKLGVLIFSICLLIHFLISYFFARRLLNFKLELDKKIWQTILKKSWPIATYMIF